MIGLNAAKKSIGILTLFSSIAISGVAYAAPEMTTPGEEEAEMPSVATPAQIESACNAISGWMKQPGMAALIQGLKNYPAYKPSHVRDGIKEACHFTPEQWAVMPDVNALEPEKVEKDAQEACDTVHALIHSGNIGVLGVLGAKKGGDLGYGEEVFHYACMGADEPGSEGAKAQHDEEAGQNPSQPDALPQTPPKEAIHSTFSFPKNDVKATEEQVAEACTRLEKGLGTHPGIIILLKGHDAFAYNPAPMADMVKLSCANITAEKIAAAPAPQTLLPGVTAGVPQGRLAALLADSANAACTNLAGKIETLPGFTAIFSKDEKGFMDACVTNAQPQQQQPQADVPDTDDQALEGEEPPVDEVQLGQACNKLLNMAVKHAGLNLLVMGHDRVPYNPAPLASAFRKQCGVEDSSWAQIPKLSAVSSKIRDASPEFLEGARQNACGLLSALSQSDHAVAYVLGSSPAMRNALQNACAAQPKAP